MKNIKLILASLLFIAFIGCEEDERETQFIEDANAPSELNLQFRTTQDNSGLVTITPTAVGATKFDVNFGDGSEDSVSLDPGQTIDNVYAEGIYTVGLTATSVNGLTTEAEQQLVVSFEAPQNLMVTIENDATVSKQVNVTATADFAMSYDVYFGEPGNDVPMTANIGEGVSYTYQEAGTYTISVIAMGSAVETTTYTENFEVTEILAPIVSAATPPLRADQDVISIFSDAYTDVTLDELPTTWSSTGFEATDIEGDNVWKLTTLDFLGMVTNYTNGVDVSGMEMMHIDYWVPSGTTNELLVKIVNTIDGGEAEQSLGTTVAGSWQSIELDMTGFNSGNLANAEKITQLLIDSDGVSGVVYIDNLYFWKTPSVLNNLPVNFDDSSLTYTWSGFGDPGFGPIPTAVIANPDPSGINITPNVLEIQKPANSQVWAGAAMALDGPIDFATNGTTLTIKVWSPRAGVPILFKTEDPSSPADGNGNPSVFAEVIATTSTANQWEELSFDMTTFAGFSTAINYENAIIFPDFGNLGQGETFYFDDVEFASKKFPINFETAALDYTWSGFGDPGFGPIPAAVISNPDMSGINISSNVLEVQKPTNSQVWAGAAMALDAPIDFSYGTTVKIKVWSPRAGVPILFKIEDVNSPPDGNGNPSVFVEITATTNTANGWEDLSFDLTSFGTFSTSIEYGNVIVFPDFGNLGQGESFYFDDFILTN